MYLQTEILSPNSLDMKKVSKSRSKFERWVYEFGGTRAVSEKMGVAKSAVNHWCNQKAIPSGPNCEKILKLANGKLTLSDILLRKP
jgi:hypothetical protein